MKTAFYKYFSGVDPPGPFVHVSLGVPGVIPQLTGQAAHVDSGAYKTVIPLAWADQLGLIPVRELSVEALDGVIVIVSTYLVELTIKDLSPVVVETLGSPGEKLVLLGRDVLNRYKVVLDGPNLTLTITEQP